MTRFQKRCLLEALKIETDQTWLRYTKDLITHLAADTKLTEIASRMRALAEDPAEPAKPTSPWIAGDPPEPGEYWRWSFNAGHASKRLWNGKKWTTLNGAWLGDDYAPFYAPGNVQNSTLAAAPTTAEPYEPIKLAEPCGCDEEQTLGAQLDQVRAHNLELTEDLQRALRSENARREELDSARAEADRLKRELSAAQDRLPDWAKPLFSAMVARATPCDCGSVFCTALSALTADQRRQCEEP